MADGHSPTDLRELVLGMMRRRVKRREDAEDLAHDTLVVALETEPRRELLGASPRGWASGIARSVYANWCRALSRGEVPDSVWIKHQDDGIDDLDIGGVRDSGTANHHTETPEALYLRAEARDAVRRETAAALTPSTERLVWARYDLDEDELCDGPRKAMRGQSGDTLKAPNGSTALLSRRFGMTTGAVKGALHYATRKLAGTSWRAADVVGPQMMFRSVTNHAVERYVERVEPKLMRAAARVRVREVMEASTYVGELPRAHLLRNREVGADVTLGHDGNVITVTVCGKAEAT